MDPRVRQAEVPTPERARSTIPDAKTALQSYTGWNSSFHPS